MAAWMDTVVFGVSFSKWASRVELAVRLLWSIPSYVMNRVLVFFQGFVILAQALHILLWGRRHKGLNDYNMLTARYLTDWYSYAFMLTDERSPLWPDGRPAAMRTLVFEVPFIEPASRVELAVRLVWAIPSILIGLGVFAAFVLAALGQMIYIALFGERNKTLRDVILSFLRYQLYATSYLYLFTDERNPLIPTLEEPPARRKGGAGARREGKRRAAGRKR